MLNVICGDPDIFVVILPATCRHTWLVGGGAYQLVQGTDNSFFFSLSFLSLNLTADLQLFCLVICFDQPFPGTFHGDPLQILCHMCMQALCIVWTGQPDR